MRKLRPVIICALLTACFTLAAAARAPLGPDANRGFSSLLREVAAGKTVTIVSRRKPVATIAPVLPHAIELLHDSPTAETGHAISQE